MDHQFWKDAWKEGRTGFHQGKYNEKLLQYFPQFHPQPNQKVLVPLCGKSKDMLWLQEQKLLVRGIELYEEAVKAFFPENHLPAPNVSVDLNYKNYSQENITISCGDFFKFNEQDSYDFIYDRASLVALPPEMRPAYVKVLHRALKKKGSYLLITYEYDESELQGPPFSIREEEIQKLYQGQFSIRLMESKHPLDEGKRLQAAPSLIQKVYILSKL